MGGPTESFVVSHTAKAATAVASRKHCGGVGVDAALTPPEAVAKAPGLRPRLDDVRPVGDSVDHRLCQPGVGEDLTPLAEGQVRRDDQRAALVALGDHLEDELGRSGGQREVAELVEDDELIARPTPARHPLLARGERVAALDCRAAEVRAARSELVAGAGSEDVASDTLSSSNGAHPSYLLLLLLFGRLHVVWWRCVLR